MIDPIRPASSALAVLLLAGLSPAVFAQPPEPRFSLSAGVRWTGRASVGERDANETTSSGGVYQLFASNTELGATTSIESSIGIRLARFLQAEAIVSYGKADLRTRISSDVEGIPDAEASESVGQLTVEGSAVIQIVAWRLPRATMPYVAAGAGYLRHLHEGRMFVENGLVYHAGGGILVPLTGTTSLRLDGRAVIRTGGAFPDDTPHVSPSAAGSFAWKF